MNSENPRLVSVEERQRILDDLETALVLGQYPTSLNDPLMKDLRRLVQDASERVFAKNLKRIEGDMPGFEGTSEALKNL